MNELGFTFLIFLTVLLALGLIVVNMYIAHKKAQEESIQKAAKRLLKQCADIELLFAKTDLIPLSDELLALMADGIERRLSVVHKTVGKSKEYDSRIRSFDGLKAQLREMECQPDYGRDAPFSIPTSHHQRKELIQTIRGLKSFLKRETKVSGQTHLINTESNRLTLINFRLKFDIYLEKAKNAFSKGSITVANECYQEALSIIGNPLVLNHAGYYSTMRHDVDSLKASFDTNPKTTPINVEQSTSNSTAPTEQTQTDGLHKMEDRNKSKW